MTVATCAEPTLAMHNLLRTAIEAEASDLHLVAGEAPRLRVHGVLRSIEQSLPGDALASMLRSVAPATARDSIEGNVDAAALRLGDNLRHDLDFSHEAEFAGETHRFRFNVFYCSGRLGACVRLIPGAVPSAEWAGLPLDVVARIGSFRSGLVLVTGVTGAGKSTTLAIILAHLVAQRGCRVVTIEEPVEYIHAFADDALITQREVGVDVPSYAAGLKYGLRQDPDVVLVGEIRDRETAQMALTAAETGHLVLTTIHTRDARGAVSRYTDLFPRERTDEICADSLPTSCATLSQHLLPNAMPGQKRVLALEVMFNDHCLPVASAIRSNNLVALGDAILTGRADGMITLDESLAHLAATGRINRTDALDHASDPTRLQALLDRQKSAPNRQAAWQ